MTLAATGDTWGISGSTFLLVYAVAAVAVGIAGTAARKRLADPPLSRPAGDLTTRPHDAALLNGGSELAVLSALSSMHLRGTISSAQGSVRAVGRLDPAADELERAIHFTTGSGPVLRKRLPLHGPVSTALATMEKRLVGDGLLLSEEQRRRIRRVGFWMLAVAALGLVRLLAGIAEAQAVGLLIVALLLVTAAAGVQLAIAPRRSGAGNRTLAALRSEHHELAPDAAPDWTVYGPAAAALGIGVFGMTALWASDPAFADELAAQRAGVNVADGGSSGGGWSGSGDSSGGSDGDGGGGGCGGCGG